MTLRIVLERLTKNFGETTGLFDVSEEIHEGDRIALLGHNGAGKTTLLNLVSTLTRPSAGTVRFFIDDQEIKDKPTLHRTLAYLSHEPMLYEDLTLLENLSFAAHMYAKPHHPKHLADLLARVGLADMGRRLFRHCSRGMRQRASLARALLAEPRLLILDEPFSGLDFEGVRRLRDLFGPQTSWLMVTHHLQLGYQLANRFWMLRRGRLRHSLDHQGLSYDHYLTLCGADSEAPSA